MARTKPKTGMAEESSPIPITVRDATPEEVARLEIALENATRLGVSEEYALDVEKLIPKH